MRQRLRRRRRALQVDGRRDPWTGPIGGVAFNARGARHDRDQAGKPEHDPSPARPWRAWSRLVVLLRRDQPVPGADPGRAALGPLPLHERRCDVDARSQRINRPGPLRDRCPRDREQHDSVLAARGPAGDVRPVEREHRLRGLVPRGVWRSSDSGSTWTQIKPSLNAAIATRARHRLTRLPNGNTRMYAGEGRAGAPASEYSRLLRSDDVATGAPVFTNLTSNDPNTQQWHSFNFCTGQCWYDDFVYTPPGHPDVLYAEALSTARTGEPPGGAALDECRRDVQRRDVRRRGPGAPERDPPRRAPARDARLAIRPSSSRPRTAGSCARAAST